jgi:hypothetical protein
MTDFDDLRSLIEGEVPASDASAPKRAGELCTAPTCRTTGSAIVTATCEAH